MHNQILKQNQAMPAEVIISPPPVEVPLEGWSDCVDRREIVKRLGIVIRVSTCGQVESDSPAVHEHRCRAFAESHGAVIVEVYFLNAVSGKSTMEHPEIKRMLNDISRGHISGVIFSKLARLCRNVRELLEFADIFQKHGAAMISLAELIDTSNPVGRVFYTLIAALAQWEREEIGVRLKAGADTRARMGRPTNGKSVLGYGWDHKKLVVKRDEVKVRIRIFRLFEQYHRLHTVIKHLTDEGFRMRNGNEFTFTSVRDLIRDTTCIGRHRSRFNWINGKKRGLKPESEWVMNDAPKIVGRELWQRCNDILNRRKIVRGPGRQSQFLFGNLLRCHCGEKMYVQSDHSVWFVCSKCRNKVYRLGLESTFLTAMKKAFGDLSWMEGQLATAEQARTAIQAQLTETKNKLLKTKTQINKLYELHSDGIISKAQFGERFSPMDEREKQLVGQLSALEGQVASGSHVTPKVVVQEIDALNESWASLAHDKKRALVESLVEKVEVQQKTLSFHFMKQPLQHPMAKSLRNYIVAQTFCQMKITIDKPVKPPKPPHKNICEPHRAFILDRLRQGYTAVQIREQLETEFNFKVSLSPVSKLVQILKRTVFGIEKPLFSKPSKCDIYRKEIEDLVLAGKSASQIASDLKKKYGFQCTAREVGRYAQFLKPVLKQKGLQITMVDVWAEHREFIMEKIHQGWMPQQILRVLIKERNYTGSYPPLHRFFSRVKAAAAKAGKPIVSSKRECVPHTECIKKLLAEGDSVMSIYEKLKNEKAFSSAYVTVYRFVQSLLNRK